MPPTLRAAYHALVKQYHPDRHLAEGMPAEFIRVSESRMAAINAAYAKVSGKVRPPYEAGHLALILFIDLIWAFNIVAVKLAIDDAGPLTAVMLRYGIVAARLPALAALAAGADGRPC